MIVELSYRSGRYGFRKQRYLLFLIETMFDDTQTANEKSLTILYLFVHTILFLGETP